MVYKVIGLMSGSSLDGLDIAYVHLQEKAAAKQGPRSWEFTLVNTACYPYPEEWKSRLAAAPGLSALEYQLLHSEYGHYLGEQVLRFIEEFQLHYQVQLLVSHGHTAFHSPARKMTAQLGDGAAIAAVTRINVVSDLRSVDVALGGQGAPIVPIGEQLLLPGYELFLNLGGIANLSQQSIAFDVCPANRVLNELAGLEGRAFDEGGVLAAAGRVDESLLRQLNALPYYEMRYPKSLANEYGTDTVLPLILSAMAGGRLTTADVLATSVEHIVLQVAAAVKLLRAQPEAASAETATGVDTAAARMLVTGGGAHNSFLTGRLRDALLPLGVDVIIPETQLADYKEALVMALIGVLRWREENNVLASVTGASRDSIGGAVWIGQEA